MKAMKKNTSENDSGRSRWASWRRCHLSKRKERGSSSYKFGGAVSQIEGMPEAFNTNGTTAPVLSHGDPRKEGTQTQVVPKMPKMLDLREDLVLRKGESSLVAPRRSRATPRTPQTDPGRTDDFPLAHSSPATPAFPLLLKLTKLVSTSGPLHLFSLPRMLFLWVPEGSLSRLFCVWP